MKTTLEERKAKLEADRAKIDARLKVLDAKATTAARKLDTRRKIFVGALVLEAAKKKDDHRNWLLDILRTGSIRKQDQAVLTGLVAELDDRDSTRTTPGKE